MSSHAQSTKYGNVGNEKLLLLAVEGDSAAVAVLADRGNTVTPDGQLRKTETKTYNDNYGKEHIRSRVIENGKVIEVDGVPVTGNITPF